MKVQVTEEDIDHGLITSARYCPVALALQRKGVLTGIVQGRWAEVKGTIYRISPAGRKWIDIFDRILPGWEHIRPITIRLDAPRGRPNE